MKKLILKYKLPLAGVVTGAIAGWCYWKLVGCASGNCPITSSPVNSTIYGCVMGYLAFSIFRKEPKNNQSIK